jgi:hypothetical protein
MQTLNKQVSFIRSHHRVLLMNCYNAPGLPATGYECRLCGNAKNSERASSLNFSFNYVLNFRCDV